MILDEISFSNKNADTITCDFHIFVSLSHENILVKRLSITGFDLKIEK